MFNNWFLANNKIMKLYDKVCILDSVLGDKSQSNVYIKEDVRKIRTILI